MDGRELYHHRERIILISNSNSSVPLWQLPVGMPIPWNACCVMQLGGVPKHTAGCSARKKYKALPPALRSLVHDNNYHYPPFAPMPVCPSALDAVKLDKHNYSEDATLRAVKDETSLEQSLSGKRAC